MNRYQEAWDFVKYRFYDGDETQETDGYTDYKKKENFMLMQELVDKVTPKKPIGRYTDYKCPVCGRRVRSGKGSSSFVRDNVCQRCFQVLDWSEEERGEDE